MQEHEIVGVSYQDGLSFLVCFLRHRRFHPMKCNVHEQRGDHAPYNVANFGHLFLREAVACGEED